MPRIIQALFGNALSGGTPSSVTNPAYGAQGPGDVDYTYDGDPEEAIKKYGTKRPFIEPSFWQRLTSPAVSAGIDQANLQAMTSPTMSMIDAQTQNRIAAQAIKKAFADQGTPISDDEAMAKVGTYGLSVRSRGLSAEERGREQQNELENREKIFAKRAATSNYIANNQYERAKSQYELGIPRQQVEVEHQQMINDIARMTKVDPANIELASQNVQRALGRAPTENDILDELASNKLYLERNVVPIENLTAERRADTTYSTIPDWDRAMRAKAAQERVMAEHIGAFNYAAPFMYNYNTQGNQSNPMYPFGGKVRNPTYSPAMFNNMMGAQMLQEKMGGGSGGKAMTLPDGSVVVPSAGTPASPIGQQQTVRPTTFAPSASVQTAPIPQPQSDPFKEAMTAEMFKRVMQRINGNQVPSLAMPQ